MTSGFIHRSVAPGFGRINRPVWQPVISLALLLGLAGLILGTTAAGQMHKPADSPALIIHGIHLSGTVTGISQDATWASDLRMDLVSSMADEFSVGGFGAGAAPVPWDFDGSTSDLDGTYSSNHPGVFPDGTAAIGHWNVAFTHTWSDGSPMTWTNIEIGLLDVLGEQVAVIQVPDFVIEASDTVVFNLEPQLEVAPPSQPTIRTDWLFSSRFEPSPGLTYPRIDFLPDEVMIFGQTGEARSVLAKVYDADGQQVANPTLNWSSGSPSAVTVTSMDGDWAVLNATESWSGTVPITVTHVESGLSATALAIMADLAPDTRLLPSSAVLAIYGDPGAQHQVIVAFNDQTANLMVGDIVLTGNYAGVMARIVAIDWLELGLLLTVEPVSFPEAFVNLELEYTGPMVQVSLSADETGAELIVRRGHDGQVLSREVFPQVSVSHLLQCSGGLVPVNGSGNFGLIQFELNWQLQPHLKLLITSSQVLELSYELSGQAGLSIPEISFLLNAGQSRNGRCQVSLGQTSLPAAMNGLVLDAIISPRAGFDVAAHSAADHGWVQVSNLERHWSGLQAGFHYTPATGLQAIADGSGTGPTPISSTVPSGPMSMDVAAFIDLSVDVNIYEGTPENRRIRFRQNDFLRLQGGPSWLFSVQAPLQPDLAAYAGPTMRSRVLASGQLFTSNDLFKAGGLGRYIDLDLDTGLSQSLISENITLAETPDLTGSVTCPGDCSSLTAGSDSVTLSLSGDFTGAGTVQFLIGQPGDTTLTELATTTASDGSASITVAIPSSMDLGNYQVYPRLCLDGPDFQWFCNTLPMAGMDPIGTFTVTQHAPPLLRPLNDTGTDWCADDESILVDCPVSTHPGQDGDYGRDAMAREGQLEKVGSGLAGFDFTKLDANGNGLPANASEWSCVRDNHTGLIWEVKVDDPSHLRHKDNTYSWYNPDPSTNGGDSGSTGSDTCSMLDGCNTLNYVLAVNSEGLCGANDWRMPTLLELNSIFDYGHEIAHDPDFFPELAELTSANVWSASSSSTTSHSARSLSGNGREFASPKTLALRVRLVRSVDEASGEYMELPQDECTISSIPSSTPSGDFRVIGDGSIVRHETTGLEWKRCALGQYWNGTTCEDERIPLSWQGALEAATDFAEEGWRVPNIRELRSIVEECRTSPAINRVVFPETHPTSVFWSSSTVLATPTKAWHVFFESGTTNSEDFWALKSQFYAIRLVRGGDAPIDPIHQPLNDTGIDWCATSSSNYLTCPATDHAGQDGDWGRDMWARMGWLEKVGSGVAGFDFTKLDINGSVLPQDATAWSCIRDNNTGLIWERKSENPSDSQHKGHDYSWYNPDADSNGGSSGFQNGGNCSGSSCDTHGYAQAINDLNLCGASDWRLPTRTELLSLSHLGGFFGEIIDSDFFGPTGDFFWTESPFAQDANRAWMINFSSFDFSIFDNPKSSLGAVKLVRSDFQAGPSISDDLMQGECTNPLVPRTTPSERFRIIGNGSAVKDMQTGLEWQRCAFGQEWIDGSCVGTPEARTWQGALSAHVESDTGISWRLPNIKELMSIVEDCRVAPAINGEVFHSSSWNDFWTSSPYGQGSTDSWTVSFDTGRTYLRNRANLYHLRLVRDPL
jgi:hypothetical protein